MIQTDDNVFVIVDSPAIHQSEPRIRLGLVKNIRFVSDVRWHDHWGIATKSRLPAFPRALQIPNPLDLMNMQNMCLLSEEISAFLGPFLFCDSSVVSGFRYYIQKTSSGDTDRRGGVVTQQS